MGTIEIDSGMPDVGSMDLESEEFAKLLNPPDLDADHEGEGEVKQDDKAEGGTSAEGASSGAAGTPNPAEAAEDGNKPVILAKDGQHTIPYAALEKAREAEAAARKQAEDAAAKAAAVQEELEALRKSGTGTAQDADAVLEKIGALKDQLADIKDEFPALAAITETISDALSHVARENAALRERFGSVEKQEQDRARAAQDQVARDIQSAIDSNAALTAWQNDTDQTAWSRAVKIDEQLQALPEWQGKPYSERFNRVVETMKLWYPDVKVPEQPLSKNEIERRVAEALRAAGGGAPPASLSDIPGGVPPVPVDTANLDPMQIESMFERMTQDQIDAWLAKNVA